MQGKVTCFNALPRAFFFSTWQKMEEFMPNKCFNALPRAFFFSTSIPDKRGIYRQFGFNALPRAFFFSTYGYKLNKKPLTNPVSMPYLGLSSFLHTFSKTRKLDGILFQCPTSGFLLFYRTGTLRHSSVKNSCFNALPRAFFFSTRFN